ncbi:MAG: hypothetical protein ABI234_13085 [Ktedonobacteraceae bacterium]
MGTSACRCSVQRFFFDEKAECQGDHPLHNNDRRGYRLVYAARLLKVNSLFASNGDYFGRKGFLEKNKKS